MKNKIGVPKHRVKTYHEMGGKTAAMKSIRKGEGLPFVVITALGNGTLFFRDEGKTKSKKLGQVRLV